MNEIKSILLTTDFSETSKHAIEPARMLATRLGAKIILVHVGDLFLPVLPEYYGALQLEDVRKEANLRAKQQLECFAQEHFGRDVDVELASPVGIPHVEIVALAKGRAVDLIVMATHGRGFISHALLGSTTERVLRQAPCPVLVVRDPGAR